MKTIIILTFILVSFIGVYGQRIPTSPRTPTIPYPVPQIPRDPEWEPPVFKNPVPREIVLPTVVEKWWNSLSNEEKESFIYGGLGTPNAEEFEKLLILNNTIKLFNHSSRLNELSEPTSRIDINTKVNELLSVINLQNSDFGKLTTLKSTQEEIKSFQCQLIGLRHFLQTSPIIEGNSGFVISIKDFAYIKYPKNVDQEYPEKSGVYLFPQGVINPQETPNEASMREAWNKNGWQRWYYNYNRVVNALDTQNGLEVFEIYGNKTSKKMRNYDIRLIVQKRTYFIEQTSKMLTLLPEIYGNANNTINRISISLNESIPLSQQRKLLLLDILAKEQVVLAKELQVSSDQFSQQQNEFNSVINIVNALKTNVDEMQKRLDELNKLITQKQESITTHQKRIVSIQAELEKVSIKLDRLRVVKFDCGRLSEDDCLQTKAYLDFELKRLDEMDKSVFKIEDLGKEILEIEKSILSDNKELENYQNEQSVKFDEFRINNEKYAIAYQELLEKRKNLDVLSGNVQAIQTKYDGSLKDLENLRNTTIISSEINTVDFAGRLNNCN